MAFGTIGISKQKGGSVGSSGRHNDRDRETPNADPKRSRLNRVLIGDDRNVRERVTEIIDEHGGKPRRDSVEAVELLLSASHEYFIGTDGEIDEGRLERWIEQSVKFLRVQRNQFNEALIKTTLEKQEFQALARERGDRLADIPLTEVMTALEYHGERRGEALLYRTRDGGVSMTVTETEARNAEGRVICQNSIDLVLFMENVNAGGDISLDDALSWLADNFGERRAAAAYVARSEQSVAGFMEERKLEIERQMQERGHTREHENREHEPSGYGFGR